MAKITWEPIEMNAEERHAHGMAQPGWFRARLPHGWLVACLTEGRHMVAGRTAVAHEGYPAGVSATFVPLGPAPWN